MDADPSAARLTPFEAARMSAIPAQHTAELKTWAADVAAVAGARDRECFMRIYDHFMPRLCRYLSGLGAPQAVAEDLAQEVLLKLWNRADLYDPSRSGLGTWLYRIARNLHIDRVRREHIWVHAHEVVEQAAEQDDGRGSLAELHTEHARLKQRLDELSATQARLIRMSYFEAKTHSEIADELNMPLGTVKSHIRRAFLQLQSLMGEKR
ncbi:MAG: sigma-70 family RNA polymerase sigma factor [Stenotrophomonas maltophilia]